MKDFLRLIASFLIFSFVFPSVTLAVSASYQSTTTVDSLWRTNGSINAMAVGPDNTLYLAGDFTSLSRNAAGIGIFDVATGTLLYPSVNTNGTINAAIPDGSGGWYIGGSFTKVNGTTRNNVARVASTGTLVTAFDADVNSIVYALAATGTTLYVGGSFSTVNSATTRSYLAAVDKTTGTVVSGFDAGLSSSVQAIVVSGDKIVAGGNFVSTASSSVPASSIVVLNATTGAVAGTLPGLTAAVSVGSLTTDDTGTIYAGGNFSYAGFSVKNLAMINATSGLRLASSTVLSDGAISAIVPDGSGGWYVGGAFTSIGGTTIKRAARINSDGSVNTTFNPDPNSTVSAIAVSRSRVYLGGSFTSIASSSFPAPSFAAVDATTGAPVATASSTGFNSSISAITVGSEGTVYVGGGFTAVGNAAKGVAFFDITTGALTSSSTGVVFEGNGSAATIYSAAADGSGGWYVGGSFVAVNGVTRNNIAHITSSGTLDTTFNPNVNSIVRALLKNGSVIYAGGDFTTVNGGTAKPRLAAFDATTGTATGTLPNIGATVHSLELYNGILYVGGSFRTAATFDGVNDRRGVGAIDLSTGSTTAFNPCVDNNPTNIYDLEVSNDILFVGGQFSTYNNCTGQTAASKSGVVGFYLDSSTGTHVYTLATSLGTVRAITATGTTLYVGGDFTTVSGVTRNRIAAIDLTTSTGTATSFDPNVNGSVYTLKLDGTTLYAGGTFTTVNNGGATRNLIAAFDTTTATNNVTSFDTGGVNSTVQILLKDGSTLFAGGAFTIAQLATRNRMMAFSSSTLAVTDFDPNVNSTVVALVASGTTLYAGGSFTSVNTGGTVATRNRLAAFDLNTTTGTVTTFDPNLGSTVNALTLNGTTLYAGGAFTTVNNSSATRNRIAAFDTTLATGNVTTFDPNVNGTASALFLSGTTLYAGGAFTTVNNGGSTRHSLAAFDTTTATNNVVAAIVPNVTNSFSQTVSALAVVGDNLLFGGTFSVYDAVARNALAAFSSSTFALTDFNPNINSTVSALVASGTTLYAGGSFTSVNTGGTVATRNRIAAFDLNTTTGTVTTFDPNLGGTVNALLINGSTLYAGGSFTAVNNSGATRNRISAFDTTLATGNVTTFDPNVNGTVSALFLSGTTLYAGGAFTTVNNGGSTRHSLAAFDTTTATNNVVAAIVPNVTTSFSQTVNALAVTGDNLLFGGSFSVYDAVARNALAAFSSSTFALTDFNPNINSTVSALVASGTTLYVGGSFTSVNTGGTVATRNRLAAFDLNTTTGTVTSFNPNMGSTVSALAIDGSTLYAGGSFTTTAGGGTTRNRVAAIDVGTALATTFDPNLNSSVQVISIVGGVPLVGGSFSTANPITRTRLAALNQTTGVPTSWDPAANNRVYAMEMSTSSIFIAGNFTSITAATAAGGGANTRTNLAEIALSDGSVTTWDPTPTGGTYALLGPVTTSSVYVAGNFTGITASSTASSRSYIAELSRFNRGEPTAWTPPTLNAAPVVCLSSLSPKAGLYLTGSSTMYLFSGSGGFTTVGGTTRNHAAEINLSDNSLTSWDPNNASGDLCDFGVDNTSVYLGGFSLTVGGTSIGSLTSVSRSTGAITSGFTTGSYSSGIMRLLVASSTVYNAGDFTTIGSASRRVAEIQISDASATAFAPAFDFASTWTARIPSILKTSDYFYVSDSNGMLVRFASSTSGSSNTAPSATIGTPAQISASSTTRFTAVVSDTNSDATSLLIQYSTDNSTWASTTLGTVTADTGTATAATGIISSIDTNSSSSVTLTIDWLSGTDIANTDDTTVYLRIKPYDGTDYAASFTTSAAFAVDTASPSAPGALTSNTIGSTTAILNLPSATSTDTNFLDYKIYYSTSSPVTTADTAFTSSTDSDLASATFNNTTTTTITGLTGNTTYYFKLFAFDSFGNSTSSAQISGTTTVPPATQPTNFSATSIGLSSIDLSWDSTGDSYMVENVTNGTTATTTATSMTLTGLSCLRTYSLRIRAYDSLGVSTSYTSPIQVTTINCGGGGGGSSSGGGGGGGSSYVAPVVPGGSNSSGFGVSQSSISLAQLQHQASILQEQLNSMGGGRDLQTGDTGPDVASIQKILVAKGLLKMPKGEGFGYFGGLTKAAVMAFQKSQGISRTGVVGPKTRAALLFGSTSTNSSVAPAPSSFKSLQQTLNKLGFVVAKTGPGSIGNETNVFGNATKEALIKFQIEYGIIKNANSQGAGVYGPKTKEKIAELVK